MLVAIAGKVFKLRGQRVIVITHWLITDKSNSDAVFVYSAKRLDETAKR